MTTCICCGGEIKKFGRFKTRSGSVQRFRCLDCGKTFNEQSRFIGLRLDEGKIIQIVRCLSEGCGVRQPQDCPVATRTPCLKSCA